MTIHGAIRLDKVNTKDAKLETLVHTADLDNGSVGFAGARATNEYEAKQFAVADATNIVNNSMLLIDTPEVTYAAGTTIVDFYNATGKKMRGRYLQVGNEITVTSNMSTGTVAVGSYVAPKAGQTVLDITVARPTTKFVGKINRVFTLYGQSAFTYIVESN